MSRPKIQQTTDVVIDNVLREILFPKKQNREPQSLLRLWFKANEVFGKLTNSKFFVQILENCRQSLESDDIRICLEEPYGVNITIKNTLELIHWPELTCPFITITDLSTIKEFEHIDSLCKLLEQWQTTESFFRYFCNMFIPRIDFTEDDMLNEAIVNGVIHVITIYPKEESPQIKSRVWELIDRLKALQFKVFDRGIFTSVSTPEVFKAFVNEIKAAGHNYIIVFDTTPSGAKELNPYCNALEEAKDILHMICHWGDKEPNRNCGYPKWLVTGPDLKKILFMNDFEYSLFIEDMDKP